MDRYQSFGTTFCLLGFLLFACHQNPGTNLEKNGSVDELMLKGQNAFHEGRYEKALDFYQKALSREPGSAAIYNLIGMNYRFQFNKLRDPEKKRLEIESFSKAVELDPAFVPARVNLGSSYYFDGNKTKAAEHFKKVLELMPNHPDADKLRKMQEEGMQHDPETQSRNGPER